MFLTESNEAETVDFFGLSTQFWLLLPFVRSFWIRLGRTRDPELRGLIKAPLVPMTAGAGCKVPSRPQDTGPSVPHGHRPLRRFFSSPRSVRSP